MKMVFKKGYKQSENHKRKLSEARLKNKEKLGYINSPKTRRKLSEANKGQIPWMKGKYHSEESKEKNKIVHLGKKQSKETILKRIKKGKDHYNWQGGETSRRRGHEWKLVRKQVLIRFEFKCAHCGAETILDVHHKKSYREIQEHKLENLIPLCKSCHMKEEHRLNKLEVEE